MGGLLFDMMANISGNLDQLDTGLEDIAGQIGIARNHLRQLVVLYRENLFVCAVLIERQYRISSRKRAKKKTMATICYVAMMINNRFKKQRAHVKREQEQHQIVAYHIYIINVYFYSLEYSRSILNSRFYLFLAIIEV